MDLENRVIFGGTFDPVHNGHFEIANDILHEFNLSSIYMLPCNIAVHKNVNTTAEQRIKMLTAATEGHPYIKIDDREIKRKGKSYMIDTLKSIKEENKSENIILVIGSDSLNNFHTWKNWVQILQLANIIVAPRNGHKINPCTKILAQITACKEELAKTSHGLIYILRKQYENTNSSYIRDKISTKTEMKNLINEKVYEIIKTERLYNN